MKNNQTTLKKHRKKLRNSSTPAEIELWKYLKGKQVSQLKFRRQHSIDNYILDFYCPYLKLAIELDGEYHVYSEDNDIVRDQVLKGYGIVVFRYENRMVFEHPDMIINDIQKFCDGLTNRF